MTIQYTLDDKKRRRLFQQILWTHIKAVFILFCIALVVGVVCIGIGFGLNYRNLWIDGFAFVGLAFLLAWICLGHYANDKQYILGERKGTKQYELTIDEDTVQLLEMDSGVLVRYNENDLRVKIKTADAIYLVFDRTQVLYFPRLSEIETVLPDPPTQSAKKRNKKTDRYPSHRLGGYICNYRWCHRFSCWRIDANETISVGRYLSAAGLSYRAGL